MSEHVRISLCACPCDKPDKSDSSDCRWAPIGSRLVSGTTSHLTHGFFGGSSTVISMIELVDEYQRSD